MNQFSRSENVMSGLCPGGAAAAGVLREVEAWTSAQCELLSGMGTIWAEWMRRQRETMDVSARSLQQMYECRNIADLFQLQQQFLAETARRSASDISNLACDTVALTSRVAGADRPGSRDSLSPQRSRTPAKPEEGAPVQRAAAE